MKKTLSLKLMLLGLLIGFGSMTTYAAKFFVNGGIVYEKLIGGVSVAGVTGIPSSGTLTIPTSVIDTADPDQTSYDVVAIADDWYKPAELQFVRAGQTDLIERVKNLTSEVDPFALKIDAKFLTSINTAALQPLNGRITQFIVTTNAGLKGVPAYAFANVPDKVVDNKNSDEYKELEALINGIKALKDENVEDYTVPVIVKGKFALDGDYKDKQVYKLLVDAYDVEIPSDNPYVILSDAAGTNNPDDFKMYKVNKTGTVTKSGYGEASLATSGTNAGKLVRKIGTKTKPVAVPLTEADAAYAAWGSKKMKGLQTQFDEADEAWRNLKQQENNFLGVNLEVSDCDYKKKELAYKEKKDAYEVQLRMDNALNKVYMTWVDASKEIKDAIKCPSDVNKAKLTEQEDIDKFEFIWNTLFNAGYAENNQTPKGYDIQDYATVHTKTTKMRDEMNKAYDEWKALIAYADNKTKAQYTNHNGVLTPVKDATDAQVKGMTLEQLQAVLADAALLRETLAFALAAAQGADDYDLTDLEDQLTKLATKPVPETDPKKFLNNEVLTKVQIDNDIMEYFGDGAFVNCIGVETDAWTAGTTSFTFPATTATIGAYAFKGTHINAKLGACSTNIQKIGDYAFQDTETQYVNLKNATQITDVDENGKALKGDDIMIGKGVWNNTPLISIALNNTGLTNMPDGLAEKIRREKTLVDGCEAEGFYVQANTTLTSVGLPVGLKKIAKNQFIWCLNLGSTGSGKLTVPGTVTSIGEAAFRGTAYKKFDLTALTELDEVGNFAFANNSALEEVLFAAEAPFENLKGSTFQCDDNLSEIELNDDIKCLPAGIFKGTALTKLDLSKTQLTVLNNLFGAKDADEANKTLVELTLPETLLDEDNYTVLRPGLKVIADKALWQLKALKGTKQVDEKGNAILDGDGNPTYRMIIPSSVELMGSFVFQNDKALENVDIIDSKLTKLGEGTFNSTDNLKEVKFITLNRIDKTIEKYKSLPTIDDADNCGEKIDIDLSKNFSFVEGIVFSKVGRDPIPDVYVTEESYDELIVDRGIKAPRYDQLYTNLIKAKQTIALAGPADVNGTATYAITYFNPYYGTWIPMKAEKQNDATVKVWTAYQDGDVIYAYGAKHNGGFYKIPAAGLPQDSKYFPSAARMFGDSNPTNGGGQNAGIPTVTVDSDNDYNYVIPETSDMKKFAKQTTNGTYVFQAEQYYEPGSAVVIITSDKNQAVNFEQHSTENTKYQSTLDFKNELKVTGKPVSTTDDDDVYKFTVFKSKWTFYQDVRDPIPALKTVFPMSPYQGTAYPDLTREIIFLDGEYTSIDDVKQYVQKMKESGDIYNMRGMKVTTPVKGQIYIQNGKKFIQK